ncbi:hypothetical protein A3I27_01845 [Candidatus Giovannonibacteria bacterium RIFCSPLOWO2_02_FULL_43_11b]|uniref:Ada DNA repair metal-binding domain-containing protein n=1 Tax=Candidatus Giovannonibacteria bacterium RIFCSPHIGHO2_12_FULL_43_15 TaxID=1798341 RepID=A0A1F5WQN5_9BACT|nr:MAG: hypothetical protein A2739_01845 [Candidatus Giovannonibacteria bacterium RIFCSPHIGHO2_01_FULL_43_100]OGF77978.1 MAG: hypothetical protein A3F23_03230 [Candidatus Giovannonibacteria bacterium RIFCSPHIGHO2_12_FULL_43_15]OGF89229.1 MAG: hypothetical protein A3I27_01845 [Candidatus Giovannonibacteria bacterium RIFCSPLOWO2_02_FULL_43_11b]
MAYIYFNKTMLKDYISKVKAKESDILLIITLITIAIIGFALGRISAIRENHYKIDISSVDLPDLQNLPQSASVFVGSKVGTIYHLSTCPGAKSIKEENKIYFNTKQEVEKAGYRPALNCPGL